MRTKRARAWPRGARIVTFARIVFVVAGIWGIVVLTPFYWLVDVTGRRYDPPTAYPHFFYGFLAVALALADHVPRNRVESGAVPSAHDPRDA